MAGTWLNKGDEHVLDVLLEGTAVQNYYLRLMTQTSNPAVTAQVGSGITEVTGTDYAAILITRGTDWSRSGSVATAAQKTFTVGAGGWSTVNGYFISLTDTGNDAIYAEAFSANKQGNKDEGDTVKVTARLTAKDATEV
jgi:hypothetical protein